MNLKQTKFIGLISAALLLSACAAGVDDTGLEYAPQMYHSTPYEPLTQIVEEGEGGWLDSNDADEHGEFYNSNPYNPHNMTMREPVPNTVRRGELLPVRMTIEDLELAATTLKSPFDSTNVDVVKKGKALYESFCKHCHGAEGNADGLVAAQYAGVANLNGAAYLDITEGHIFHVITYGKGLMGAHGSQISPEDRWRIARYVKELQNKN